MSTNQKGKIVYISGLGITHMKNVLEHAPRNFDIEIVEKDIDENEIVAKVKTSDFILLEASGLSERVLTESPHVKLIQVFHQGFDRIPLDMAAKRGIPVSNIGGTNAAAVAEHTIMLMLAVLRRLPFAVNLLLGTREDFLKNRGNLFIFCHELAAKTVGIVGLGNIGKKVAKILHGFDVDVIYYDTVAIPHKTIDKLQIRKVEFDKLLEESDIVTLHAPLNEYTRGIINQDSFNKMKTSAILINTSRGALVDEKALIQALKKGKIAGAGLDVLEQEPAAPDNPLLHMENVVVTPHIAGFVYEDFGRRIEVAWGNFSRVWKGEDPINIVNKL